jgi:hypothetical protein
MVRICNIVQSYHWYNRIPKHNIQILRDTENYIERRITLLTCEKRYYTLYVQVNKITKKCHSCLYMHAAKWEYPMQENDWTYEGRDPLYDTYGAKIPCHIYFTNKNSMRLHCKQLQGYGFNCRLTPDVYLEKLDYRKYGNKIMMNTKAGIMSGIGDNFKLLYLNEETYFCPEYYYIESNLYKMIFKQLMPGVTNNRGTFLYRHHAKM